MYSINLCALKLYRTKRVKINFQKWSQRRMNILWRKEISLSLRLSVLDAHFWRRTLIESFIVDEPFVEVEETQTRGGSGQRGWVEGVPESCKGRLIPPWSHLIDVPRLPPSKSYCPSCSFQSALSFHSPFTSSARASMEFFQLPCVTEKEQIENFCEIEFYTRRFLRSFEIVPSFTFFHASRS